MDFCPRRETKFGALYFVQKQYMTLGPKFIFYSKMAVARRPMELFQIWTRISKTLVEIQRLPMELGDLYKAIFKIVKLLFFLPENKFVFYQLKTNKKTQSFRSFGKDCGALQKWNSEEKTCIPIMRNRKIPAAAACFF